MALVGNISGSNQQEYAVGITGSHVIIANPDFSGTASPAGFPEHEEEFGPDVILFVSGTPGGKLGDIDSSTAVIWW